MLLLAVYRGHCMTSPSDNSLKYPLINNHVIININEQREINVYNFILRESRKYNNNAQTDTNRSCKILFNVENGNVLIKNRNLMKSVLFNYPIIIML